MKSTWLHLFTVAFYLFLEKNNDSNIKERLVCIVLLSK